MFYECFKCSKIVLTIGMSVNTTLSVSKLYYEAASVSIDNHIRKIDISMACPVVYVLTASNSSCWYYDCNHGNEIHMNSRWCVHMMWCAFLSQIERRSRSHCSVLLQRWPPNVSFSRGEWKSDKGCTNSLAQG